MRGRDSGHGIPKTREGYCIAYFNSDLMPLSVVVRNNTLLKKLVHEPKRTYEKDAEHHVHIFIADAFRSWHWNGARQKRPMSSIVLEPGVKDMSLNDCKVFVLRGVVF